MFAAFGRLIFIAIASVTCLAFALIVLGRLGQGQRYAESDHPLMKEKTWLIYDSKTTQLTGLENRKIMLKLPVRLAADGSWVVADREAYSLSNGEMKAVVGMSPADLEQAGVQTLAQTLAAYEISPNPFKAYYLEVLDGSGTRLSFLSETIQKLKLDARVLFSSPYTRVNIEMRKLKPLWLYGASTSDMSKLRFFNSLFIESVATVNADFMEFVTKPHPRLVAEMNHRHRRVLFNLKSDLPPEKLPASLGGWVISDPALLAKYVALAE